MINRHATSVRVDVNVPKRRSPFTGSWGDSNPPSLASGDDGICDDVARKVVIAARFPDGSKVFRHDEAVPLHLEVLETWKRVLGDDHPNTLVGMGQLGESYVMQKRPELAEPLLADAVARARRVVVSDQITGIVMRQYGTCLTALGRHDEAEGNLLKSHEILTSAGGADYALTVKVIPNLVELYEAWNKPAKAAEWRAKLPEKATG